MPLKCPSCEAVLSAAELSDGWCETCGKKVPPDIEEQARRGFGEPHQKEVGDVWIKADVDHLFEPAPRSIVVTKRRGRSSSTSRTYLLRGAPAAP